MTLFFQPTILVVVLIILPATAQDGCNSELLKDNSQVEYKSSSFSGNNNPSKIGHQNGKWCIFPWDKSRWIDVDLNSMYVLNRLVVKYHWPDVPGALSVKDFVVSWSESGDIDKWNSIGIPFSVKTSLHGHLSEHNVTRSSPIVFKTLRINVTSPNNGMFCMGLQLYGCSAVCSKLKCSEGFQCTISANGKELCERCLTGYIKKGDNCIAEFPCASAPCNEHSRCISHIPYDYACVCKQHFMGNGKTCARCGPGFLDEGHGCIDINECLMTNYTCAENQNCINTDGSYYCQCKSGFSQDRDNNCNDIDECKQDAKQACPSDKTTCVNKEGYFQCDCIKTGYIWLNENCVDINECKAGQHSCKNAVCENTDGGYKCRCKTGYKFRKNDIVREECVDNDECLDEKFLRLCDTMDAVCKNTIGSYKCVCEVGYMMSDELSKCVDRDECKDDKPCSEHAFCRNLQGAYRCTCKPGYAGDGRTCVQDLATTQKERNDKIALISGSGGGALLSIIVVIAIVWFYRKKTRKSEPQDPLMLTTFDPGFDPAFDPGFEVGYDDGIVGEVWQQYDEDVSDYETYDESDDSDIGTVFESYDQPARDNGQE